MRRNSVTLLLAVFFLSGCYKVTVTTGAPPGPQVVDRPWQMSWISGLVPPPTINVQQECPRGIARVVTQRSFLNGLVAAIQSAFIGIAVLSPMHATVTCAAGDAPTAATQAGPGERPGS